ncbi:MAG TPA: glycosyltransferase family 1 protein [Candidatus Woesebacteria bacterium]|nr:glycosyltransferase family 1 protein [Candidatus Woesebacteria bacterium]
MANKIKVFLDSGTHSQGRGVGFYADNLAKALEKSPSIILTDKNPDIIHYPFFDLFYHTLPIKKKNPTIVTVHDLTPLVLSSRYPKGAKGIFNLTLQWLALQSVSAIITDSENSKNDLIKLFRLPPEKITVIPLAIDSEFQKNISPEKLEEVRNKYHLPKKFILTVAGGPNPNKNLPSLAEVTDRLGIPLVIVGKGMLQEVKEPVHPELIDMVRLKVYKHLILPGFVPTEDLNALYRLASLYVQPSLYEGFGLPLLEAMTAGCLIASSKVSSLPEIYHEGAIVFNPRKLSSIEKAIKKALSLSPKAKSEQITQAKEKSTSFSWTKTAKATSIVYQKVKEDAQN